MAQGVDVTSVATVAGVATSRTALDIPLLVAGEAGAETADELRDLLRETIAEKNAILEDVRRLIDGPDDLLAAWLRLAGWVRGEGEQKP